MNKLIKNKTAQNTFTLYGAIILNILLGWVVAKLNTHYLTVEEYGQYAFFIVVIYYSRVFFTFGTFESASRILALEKNSENKRKYFGASFVSAFVFIIPFMLILVIFSLYSDSLFKVKVGNLYSQNLIFAGFVIIQSLLISTLRGSGKIKILSFFTFSPRIFHLLFLGYLIILNEFTLSNSLYTMFFGLIISIVLILILIKPNFIDVKQKLFHIFYEIKQYGIHIYFGNIMHETLVHADKFLISFYFNSDSMAYYGFAYMLTYPLSHFSTSLATTLFNKFASQQKINNKVLRINFLYIFVSVSIFVALREPIIRYLFSVNYLPAVGLMLPLALAFGFSGLSKPYALYLMAKGYGKIVRNISIITPVFNISLNLFLIPIYGISGAAWSASAAYGFDLILYILYYHKLIKSLKNDR